MDVCFGIELGEDSHELDALLPAILDKAFRGSYNLKVVGLKNNDADVETVSAGEIGLKLSDKMNISTHLWKPITNKNADECIASNL